MPCRNGPSVACLRGRLRLWLCLISLHLILLCLIVLCLPRLGLAQTINTGTLFITAEEVVMVDGDFIQADSSQRTTNQGTLLIAGALRFVDGVIDEVGGTLHGGWREQPRPPLDRPNFHTIFLASSSSQNPSAQNEGGIRDALIDGPVRRSGGGQFIFPTGDVRQGQVHRGLAGLSAPTNAADVDAMYSWRNGQLDFGNRLGTLVIAVSPKEYWQVWGDSGIDISLLYEASSAIGQLISDTPGATLNDLTLVGWDGQAWVDLSGQTGRASDQENGRVTAHLSDPRRYRALTFGIRLKDDEDSDGDGVPNDKEWDSDNDGTGPDDTDGDGTPDYLDPDDDGDGIPTRDEDWNRSGTPCDDDSDSDGIPDYLDPYATGELRLWVTKTVNRDTVALGKELTWTLSVENKSAIPLSVTLVDILPVGLAIDIPMLRKRNGGRFGIPPNAHPGRLYHPQLSQEGLMLHWPDIKLDAGAVFDLSFSVQATVGLRPGHHRNQAYAFANHGGNHVFSNLAETPFRRHDVNQIDCATVIGRVFDDKNLDGHLNVNEPGIAAVRIGEQSGLLITTDKHGRFHLPCELVQRDLGRNLVLKLDPRTLPTGFAVSSENPRIIRLTRGKMVLADFGATLSREVTLDVHDCTFIDPISNQTAFGSDPLHPSWEHTLRTLIPVLEKGPARLVVEYTTMSRLHPDVLQSRLDRVESAFWEEWRSRPRRHSVTLSTRFRRFIGTEAPPCDAPVAPATPPSTPTDGPWPNLKTLPPEASWSKGAVKPARERRFFAATQGETR